MSVPTDFDLRYIARLAHLDLTDAEVARFEPQLNHVLDYMAKLDEVDVAGIEPTAHANPVLNVMRPDRSRPSLDVREALANAPQATSDQFIVPKVVE